MYLSIFGALLLGVLFIFLFIFSIVIGVLRSVFGIGRNIFSSGKRTSGNTGTGQRNEASPHHNAHKKVFDKDEGEYVDFEEIDS